MDASEALLLSVESILGDDGLDNAGRNAALAETLKQFSDYTAPQAKATILKREDAPDGQTGFDSEHDTSAERARLRQSYEDARRRYPNLSDEDHKAFAWRLLGSGERRKLLEEADTGEDLTFDHERVEVGKLATFALECSAAALQKAQPSLTNQAAFAAACDAKPELFKVVREARRADLVKGNAGPTDAVVARRFYATQLLTAHADELCKAEPTLSQAAARIEARRLHPDIAAREKA